MQVTVTNGAVTLDGAEILSEINFSICDKDRVALVGRNGCGKTTLLRALTGQIPFEKGDGDSEFGFFVTGKPKLGYLEQVAFNDGKTLFEEVLSAYADVVEAEDALAKAQEKMEQNSNAETVKDYSDKFQRFEFLGGYTYKKECLTAIAKFGFADEKDKPLSRFSGGQRTKIALLKTLLSRPDVLLLDEPTNHLDLDGIEWLENYLKNYPKAFVVVSHDRMFLDRTVNVVYEIEYGASTRYKGNYSAFAAQKQADFDKAQKDSAFKAKEAQRLQSLIDRFRYKANKAAMAQAKIAQLNRLGDWSAPVGADSATFHADFQPTEATVSKTLVVDQLVFGYDKPLGQASFTILYGDKLGVVGGNGCGKSTFVKTLVRKIRQISGRAAFGLRANVGYFDQSETQSQSTSTVLDDFLSEFPSLSNGQARTALGAFQLSGEDVFKRVCDLSGGEKVRFALCKVFRRKPNVLVLDEPTNHMDIVGKETIEKMLCKYTGTVIVVSHDRYLIDKVCNKLLVFENGGCEFFPMGYTAYEQQRKEKPSNNAVVDERGAQTKPTQAKVSLKQREKTEKRLSSLEKEITTTEEQLEQVQNEMCQSDVVSDFSRLKPLQDKQQDLEQTLQTLLAEWESLGS